MILRAFLVTSLWLLTLSSAQAQKTRTLNPVSGGVYTTAEGQVLLFNNHKGTGLNFSLTLPKEADVKATNRTGVYIVNGQSLQVTLVPIAAFKSDSASVTLQRYIGSEANYLSRSFSQPIVPFVQIEADKQSGRLYAVWGFTMPAGTNQQVARQVFLNFIDGNYIIGLGGAQLQGQALDQVLALLFQTAHSYTSSRVPIVPLNR